MKTKTHLPNKSKRILFIFLWNVTEAPLRSNAITLYTKFPNFVLKLVKLILSWTCIFDDILKINLA